MRPASRFTALALGVLALISSPSALAAVVPVDPGPITAGRPILGTGQNLPPLGSGNPYDAGSGFATVIRAYYESGSALKDQRDVSAAARRGIGGWVERHCQHGVRSCQAAVVFDIDETLLSNYSYYSTTPTPFTYDEATFEAYVRRCGQSAIAPVRRLMRDLVRAGVPVILLTGRPADQRAVTRDCLRERGIDGWERLIVRDARFGGDTEAEYKAAVRASLQRDGYRIVASIGDQVSDMSYGRLKHGYLLPNGMYYLP